MRQPAPAAGRARAESTKPGRPFFICAGHGPDVEGAGREAAVDGVGHELGSKIVEVRLQEDDLAARGLVRSPTKTRTTFGR